MISIKDKYIISLEQLGKTQKKNIKINKIIYYYGVGGASLAGYLADDILKFNAKKELPIKHINTYTNLHHNKKGIHILCSFSGNTHEIIYHTDKINDKNNTFAITTGGKLEQKIGTKNTIHIKAETNIPRDWSLLMGLKLYQILSKDITQKQIESTIKLIKKCDHKNHIKTNKSYYKTITQITIAKTIIILYDERYRSIAIRAKQQLNENNKIGVILHETPNDDHNNINAINNNKETVIISIGGPTTNPHARLKKDLILKNNNKAYQINIDLLNFKNYFEEIILGFYIIDNLSLEFRGKNPIKNFIEVPKNDKLKIQFTNYIKNNKKDGL